MIAAKRGDFYLRAIGPDQHDAEMRSDQLGGGEQGRDLVRRGIGRDVEILGRPMKQEIAHAAAYKVGLPSTLFASRADAPG